MRELNKALAALEESLVEMYGLSLNEAMVMCSMCGGKLSAGEISQATGLRASHLSKVLRSIEDKGFLIREFCDRDRRKVCFSLTEDALRRMDRLRREGLPVPELLRDFFACGG